MCMLLNRLYCVLTFEHESGQTITKSFNDVIPAPLQAPPTVYACPGSPVAVPPSVSPSIINSPPAGFLTAPPRIFAPHSPILPPPNPIYSQPRSPIHLPPKYQWL